MTDSQQPQAPAAPLTRFDAAAFALTALIALVNLPYPFMGDQASYALMGRLLTEGWVLYRDVWDVKQPGLPYFYAVAGGVFGFTELGIHLCEFLYMAALAVVLRVTAGRGFRTRAVAAIPLFTVGVYYAAGGMWHFTQVEALVGFPVYLSMWLALSGDGPPRPGRLFCSGLLAGPVALFKLMYLPLPAVFWLVALGRVLKAEPQPGAAVFRAAGAIAAGAAVSLLVCFGPAVLQAGWHEVYWSNVVYPQRLSGLGLRSVEALRGGLEWFITRYGPLFALGAVGAIAKGVRRRDPLVDGYVWWLPVGAGLMAIQLWWPYHYNLLLLPGGLLAAKGLDVVLAGELPAARNLKPAVAGALAFLVAVAMPGGVLAKKCLRLARYGFATAEADRRAFQAELNPSYPALLDGAAMLRAPDALPGPIFVFGNPLYYIFSGRDPALRFNGWPLRQWLPEMWAEASRTLTENPPPYLFVRAEARDQAGVDFLAHRAPGIVTLLETRYTPVATPPSHGFGAGGAWYQLMVTEPSP